MRMYLVGLCFSVLLAGDAPPHLDLLSSIATTKEYREAYQQGAREAKQELADGRATLYTCGLGDLFERLDRDTGLRYQAIAGCVVDDAVLGRSRGHNDTIRKFIATKGLPTNSFKRWEKDVFALREYFENAAKGAPQFPLAAGDFGHSSPNEEFSVRLVRRPAQSLEIEVTQPGNMPLSAEIIVGDTVECVWGPKDSRFLVARSVRAEKKLICYMALDLSSARWLRFEFDDPKNR